jgi:regulator of protease activity HflC (stomatin/prohibitin superfamily)
MQASKNSAAVPLWAKVAYGLLSLLIALLVYQLGSVWAGHIALILLAFIATSLLAPDARRIGRVLHVLLSSTLLLATAIYLLLTGAEQAGNVGQSPLLGFLLGDAALTILGSFLIAFLFSGLVIGAAILLAVHVSAEWILTLREVEKITLPQAYRLLRSMFLRISYPWLIVEDGDIKESKPKGLLPALGGPGRVVIKPYNAVVFERSGNTTRIEGPGLIVTERFEFAKSIVDLRKQWINFTTENVLTKDHVPLTFECGVGFRIESRVDTDARRKKTGQDVSQTFEGSGYTGVIDGDYPVYKSTLYKAVYNTTAAGWELTTRGATETQLRNIVRNYLLEDLYCLEDAKLTRDRSAIDKITDELLGKVSDITPNWGTSITSLQIKHFEVPDHVNEELTRLWAARYAGKTQVLGAEGKREAMLIDADADKRTDRVRLQAEKARITGIADAEREASEMKSESIVGEARAKASAAVIEGRGQAEARVELYRRMLSLQPSMDEETLWEILKKLQSMDELRAMARLFFVPEEKGRRRGLGALMPPSLVDDEPEDTT